MGEIRLCALLGKVEFGTGLCAVCVSANSADSFVLRRYKYLRCKRNVEYLVIMDNEGVCEMDIFVDSIFGDRAKVFAVSTYCSVGIVK